MAGKEQGRKKYQQKKNKTKTKNKIESPTSVISKKWQARQGVAHDLTNSIKYPTQSRDINSKGNRNKK